jgi:hypothetical protein
MTFPIHIFLKKLSWKHSCKSLNRSGRNLESFFRYLRQDSVSSVKGESTFRSNAGTTSAFTGMPVSPTECADVEFDQYITLDFTTWLRSADGIRSTSIMSTWDVLRHLIPYSSLDWLDSWGFTLLPIIIMHMGKTVICGHSAIMPPIESITFDLSDGSRTVSEGR